MQAPEGRCLSRYRRKHRPNERPISRQCQESNFCIISSLTFPQSVHYAVKEARGNEPTIFASFSCGALACAISLYNLKDETVGKRYTELMEEEGVAHRMFGMAFIWGKITRNWLEEVLPDNGAEICEAF